MASDATGNSVVFGRRKARPTPMALPAAIAPKAWPFTSKNTGLKRMASFILALALVGLTQLLPTVLKSHSVASFLAQNGGLDLVIMLALVGFIVFGLKRRLSLTIDQEGVVYRSGRETWQYAWDDIDRAVETTNAVRLILKGRTEAQNRFNVIPATAAGLKTSELEALIAYGLASFGASTRLRTVAQGDDLKRAKTRSQIVMQSICALVFGSAFLLAASVFLGGALDASRLQKSGVSTTATVTRLYTGGCGKRSCSILADYAFTAKDPRSGWDKTYSGAARVASDANPSDPDLLSVKATATIPIAYDRNAPGFSRENFRNHLFRAHPWASAVDGLLAVGGVLLVIWAAIAGLIYVSMRKA